jgi:hypothetical protein
MSATRIRCLLSELVQTELSGRPCQPLLAACDFTVAEIWTPVALPALQEIVRGHRA